MLQYEQIMEDRITGKLELIRSETLVKRFENQKENIQLVHDVLETLKQSNLGFPKVFTKMQEILDSEIFFDHISLKSYESLFTSFQHQNLGILETLTIVELLKTGSTGDKVTHKNILLLLTESYSRVLSSNKSTITELKSHNEGTQTSHLTLPFRIDKRDRNAEKENR